MLLAIDTCGGIGTVALARREGGRLISLGELELIGKTFAATLVIRIRELLSECDVSLQQLEAIVVVNGPGSFTGVRVGVSTAKGIADALAVPVVAVSRLEVLAKKAGLSASALDAGRGEFYLGRYNDGAHEMLVSPEEIRAAVSPGDLAVCEEKAVAAFPEARRIEPPRASDAFSVALSRLMAQDFDDISALDGNYLRRSDAEVKREAALGRPSEA